MIIDGKTYSSVAIVDDQNYLVAVLNDSESICAGDFKVIAENKEGGLVFVPQENNMVKCFIRSSDGSSFGSNQMTMSEYVSMIKSDPNTKFENEEQSMRVTKGTLGNAGIFDMISKLPPQVVEVAIKNIVGNTAAFKQNQKNTEKQASGQEEVPEDKEKNDKKYE